VAKRQRFNPPPKDIGRWWLEDFEDGQEVHKIPRNRKSAAVRHIISKRGQYNE